MDWGALVALPVLALVDSTSFGTLLLPAWLLLAPRIRLRAVLGYLALVATAYWLLGLALLVGAGAILSVLNRGDERPIPLLVAQLLLGVALLGWALLPSRWRGPAQLQTGPGPLLQWRDRVADGAAPGGMLALAAVAVLLEVGTMLPYLGAVTLLASSGLTPGASALALLAYCLMMVAPALLLVLGRVLAAHRVEPVLQQLDRWSRRAGGEALLWVAGIAGFLLAGDAAAALGAF